MVKISTDNITKHFGKVVACDHVNLEIEDGRFFTILGPSGCGKTTLLRIIAGFEMPDRGSVYFDGQDVTDLPPNERNTGMVFQNYALWPHMRVFDNVAYGLRVRKVPRGKIEKRVDEALELVQLRGLEERTPFQLSGGQQQRVALARALVIEPRVLLLDEPLSNLDAKLRLEMRHEIMRIQKELGITTVYVTHDQEEALSISDRIAIQRNGAILQVGSPREIYKQPKSRFIADFIGQSTFILGRVTMIDRYAHVKTEIGLAIKAAYGNLTIKPGDQVLCSIRPEDFLVREPEDGEYNSFKGEVTNAVFVGRTNRVYARVGGLRMLAEVDSDVELRVGEAVSLYSLADETTILPLRD
ncbi:MAG: ABC transporter ATP-binding protein [Candidatus Bathyarchaeia archaeon]